MASALRGIAHNFEMLEKEKAMDDLKKGYGTSIGDEKVWNDLLPYAIRSAYMIRGLWQNSGEPSDYFDGIKHSCKVLGTLHNRIESETPETEESLRYLRSTSPLYDELHSNLESIDRPWNDESYYGHVFFYYDHQGGLREKYESKLLQIRHAKNKNNNTNNKNKSKK